MKRMHIHVGVTDLEESIQFYSAVFGQGPVKQKPDYAKWLIEEPRVNFAVSTRSGETGVNHLGIQVESDEELEEITNRMKSANLGVFDEGETTCCYSESSKAWVIDPAGIPWEAYRNMADAEVYSSEPEESAPESTCCVPDEASSSSCC